MANSIPYIVNEHFKQTKEVITDPLAGVSITMLPFITDTTKLDLFMQLIHIKECVAPISMIIIKGMLLMKQVPRTRLSNLEAFAPLKANTFIPY